MRVGRPTLKVFGKTLCAAGALLLSFVAYQLWGTSLSEHAAQSRLRTEFHDELHHDRGAAGVSGASAGSRPEDDTLGSTGTAGDGPAVGSPVGLLSIPRLGVTDVAIVQGVGTDQLRQGPGHYPGSPLPGQPGNAAIAGHRTTYSAPFYNLNALHRGDPITVETLAGTFRYAVTRTQVVAPSDAKVLDATAGSTLTLTTCTPRYSATNRLVVAARLVHADDGGAFLHLGAVATPAVGNGATLAGSGGSALGVVLWGALTVAGGGALWVLRRTIGLRVPSPARLGMLVVGAGALLASLFVLYGQISALLPASF